MEGGEEEEISGMMMTGTAAHIRQYKWNINLELEIVWISLYHIFQ